MIFVIGGRCQGKSAFAVRMALGREPGFEAVLSGDWGGRTQEQALKEAVRMAADGRNGSLEEALHAGLILHLEWYVRRMMERGESPEDFVSRLLEENERAVVTADEIGSGIVPAEAFERDYRERAGRLCQRIAGRSSAVYRVVCGLGLRIK